MTPPRFLSDRLHAAGCDRDDVRLAATWRLTLRFGGSEHEKRKRTP